MIDLAPLPEAEVLLDLVDQPGAEILLLAVHRENGHP
jgi:hypothetical protein